MKQILKNRTRATVNAARKTKSQAPDPAQFAVKTNGKLKKVEDEFLPLVRPASLSDGSTVGGKILAIAPGNGEYDQELLRIKHDNGSEFLFPVTAVIRRKIARALSVEEDKIVKAVGRSIAIAGAGQGTTKRGKPVNLFDVWMS